MTKELAVTQIWAAANERLRRELAQSQYMKDELTERLDCYLSYRYVKNYTLIEYNNGFYLGEFRNNRRNGIGMYLRYNSSTPNDIYIGHWQNDLKNGDGFYCMPNGVCYCGEFVNNKFQGKDSHYTGCCGKVDFHAEFYNGDIVRVFETKGAFTYNGKRYGNNDDNEGNDRASGFYGIIVIIIVILGCLKFCGNC